MYMLNGKEIPKNLFLFCKFKYFFKGNSFSVEIVAVRSISIF